MSLHSSFCSAPPHKPNITGPTVVTDENLTRSDYTWRCEVDGASVIAPKVQWTFCNKPVAVGNSASTTSRVNVYTNNDGAQV